MNDQSATQKFPVLPVYARVADEIRLWDVWQVLVRRRRLIAAIPLLCVVAAVVYLIVTPATFRATIILLPPHPHDVIVRNVQGDPLASVGAVNPKADPPRTTNSITQYTTSGAFEAFVNNLGSRALRREFFDEQDVAPDYGLEAGAPAGEVHSVFDREFNKALQVSESDTGQSVRLSFDFGDRDRSASLANAFVSLAHQRTVEQLLQTVQLELNGYKSALLSDIERKRQLARKIQSDEIVRLREAADVAGRIGLVDGSTLSRFSDAAADGEIPLYLRGENALRAEIQALENRKRIDPYVTGLRNVQEELKYLEAFVIDSEMFRVAVVDEAAVPPRKAVKPRRSVVLAGVFFASLFIAVLIALVSDLIARQRDQDVAGSA